MHKVKSSPVAVIGSTPLRRSARDALAEAAEAAHESSALVARAVARARVVGLSEQEVADVLGVHRNTLAYRYGARSGPRFDVAPAGSAVPRPRSKS